MRLGVPFIAPRQLGAVGGQQGRPSLPSVGWRTGQSGASPNNHCRRSGVDLLPILTQMIVAPSGQLAHRTLSGAHRTVRCPLPTVGAGHASPADCTTDIALATVGSPDSAVHHRTVRWIIAIHRRFFPRAAFSPESSLTHRTVRCARLSWTLAAHSQVTCNSFLFFFVSST
jgi:hypothetical protein